MLQRKDLLLTQLFDGGYIDDIDAFAADFFNISPREACEIDPQQRIALEQTWLALENANINPDIIRGTHVGVYVGVTQNDYALSFT